MAYQVNSSRCIDLPRAKEACLPSHWLEVALFVSAVVLTVAAVLAFSQIGAFSTFGTTAHHIGFALTGVVGLIVLGELVYKAIRYCKLKPKKSVFPKRKELSSRVLKGKCEKLIGDLQTEAEQAEKKRPIKNIDTFYAKNLSATQKLLKQMCYALLEGLRNQKKESHNTFSSASNRTKTTKLIDSSIKLSFVGAAEAQGNYRHNMEDAHTAVELTIHSQKAHFIGVFDGHGDNKKVANYLKHHLANQVSNELNQAEELSDHTITNALTKVFVKIDDPLLRIDGGSTATCALILEDGRIYIPNVGDSRTVLVREDHALQLTEDAEPDNERFKRGIKNMGHTVLNNRVNHWIAVARDLGQPILSARPKITRIDKDVYEDLKEGKVGYSKGDLLVLACDGLWDVCTTSELHRAVNQMRQKGYSVQEIAANLVQGALKSGSTDNVSVVVVKL